MTNDNSDAGTIRYCTRGRLSEALALGWELWCDFECTHHWPHSAGFVIWLFDSPAPWPWAEVSVE